MKRILDDQAIMHIMTTNNYTERLNRIIESQHSDTKTVVNFVKGLYDVQLIRENLTSQNGNLNFKARLAIVFDMQTIEQVYLYYFFIILFIYF